MSLKEDTRSQDGAAGAVEQSAPPKAGGSKLAPWLPLIASIVLMPLLAFGVTRLVLVPQLRSAMGTLPSGGKDKADGAHGAPAKGGEAGAAGEKVALTKLLVNVSGTMGSRYLLTSITLVGAGAPFRDQVTKFDAQLRDTACGLLSTKTLADLEKPGARNLVRAELLSAFNQIMGSGSVQELFITEFAIQ